LKSNIVITGSKGLLGQDLSGLLSKKFNVIGFDLPEKDLTDPVHIKGIQEFSPEFIINCAAMTDVDGCETNRKKALEINASAVFEIAKLCKKINSKLIHISTDYVFDGEFELPEIDSVPDPKGFYGFSKLMGEFMLLKELKEDFVIIRTNVLFGRGSRASFTDWVYKSLKENKKIKVVNDQYSNPCYVEELSRFINHIIYNGMPKQSILHSGCPEYLNRYDFTKSFCDVMELSFDLVQPVSSKEIGQKAKRPLKGGLSIKKTEDIIGYKFASLKENFYKLKKILEEG